MDDGFQLLAQRVNSTQRTSVTDPGPAVLNLWLFLNIGPSHVLLPLLCLSLLLQRGRRNLLLMNVAITWCICGFASSLLLYAGKETGPEPSTYLCTIQASLLYAIPPLTSTAVLSLVSSVWINLCWKRGEPTRGFYLAFLLVGPYVVYFTFAAIGAMLGSQEPSRVSRARRFFYCSINHNLFSGVLALFAALVLCVTIVLLAWIGITIWRNNRILKAATNLPQDYPVPIQNAQDKRGIRPDDVQFAIRLGIFGVYIVIGLTLSLLSIISPTSAVPDVIFATMGLAVFLVFGTQPKLWTGWRLLFRRNSKEEDTHVPTLTPFQLDPAPGQDQQQYGQQQYNLESQSGGTIPPPVPDKSWRGSGAGQLATPVYDALNSGPSRQQPVMAERRVPAVRFQVPRPQSTATILDHPYRTATSPEPISLRTTSNSPFGMSMSAGRGDVYASPPDGRGLSSYGSQSNLLAAAAAVSYDDRSRLAPVASESYESDGPLAAAASYQSRYLTPTGVGPDDQSFAGTGSGVASGYATYGNSDDDGYEAPSYGRQPVRNDGRGRMPDPIIPRY